MMLKTKGCWCSRLGGLRKLILMSPQARGASGGLGGAGGPSWTISISARAVERLASCASVVPLMRR